jgi:hypothetical protein
VSERMRDAGAVTDRAGVPLRRVRAVERAGRLSLHPQGRPCGRPPPAAVLAPAATPRPSGHRPHPEHKECHGSHGGTMVVLDVSGSYCPRCAGQRPEGTPWHRHRQAAEIGVPTGRRHQGDQQDGHAGQEGLGRGGPCSGRFWASFWAASCSRLFWLRFSSEPSNPPNSSANGKDAVARTDRWATSGPHPGHERPDHSGQQRSLPA